MNNRLRQWLPILICCLPTVALIALMGLGGAVYSAMLSSPLGLGLIVLAALACPLSMVIHMHRPQRGSTSSHSHIMADCCMTSQSTAYSGIDSPSERLAALRQRREALEHELAALQEVKA